MVSIRLCDLAHEFDGREVFRSIDFAFDGSCAAITGPNGSGKSTLVKIVAGLLTPTDGEAEVLIAGHVATRSALRNIVGVAAPDVCLYADLTVRENLEFLVRTRGRSGERERATSALEEVGLAGRADDPVGELSSGLLQRARIAAALVHEPFLLLLDEPSSNLDSDGMAMARSVIERQRRRGMVIVATNEAAEAEIAEARIDLGTAK